MSDYMSWTYSYYRFMVSCCYLSDIGKCLTFGASCSKTGVFCLVYTHAFSIHRFSLFICGVSFHRFPFLMYGKLCKFLICPNFFPFMFNLLLNLLPLFFIWDFLSWLIVEWISEWKKRDGLFPMWRRFSSKKTVWSTYCITVGPCNCCRVPTKKYRCISVS